MNPDKLFNYLDGKLPSNEREAIDEQLLTDAQLQREVGIARKIHERIAANPNASSEVILPSEDQVRAGVLGRRIAIAFSVLVALNVGFGLLFIAHREASKAPKRGVEDKSAQVRQWAEKAGETALPAPTIREFDLSMTVPGESIAGIVTTVSNAATRSGGSATSAPPSENGKVVIIADVPSDHFEEFSNALSASGFSATDLRQIPRSSERRQITRISLTPVGSR